MCYRAQKLWGSWRFSSFPENFALVEEWLGEGRDYMDCSPAVTLVAGVAAMAVEVVMAVAIVLMMMLVLMVVMTMRIVMMGVMG